MRNDEFYQRWTDNSTQASAASDDTKASPAPAGGPAGRATPPPAAEVDTGNAETLEAPPAAVAAREIEPDRGTEVIKLPAGIPRPVPGSPQPERSSRGAPIDSDHRESPSGRGAQRGPADTAAPVGVSVGPMRAAIREAELARPYKPIPQTGWRNRIHRTTRINLGLSQSERQWNDLRRRIAVNLRGTYVIAVMQAKGGVSKSTTTIGLGAALAKHRDDKVVAIDANPADGNLSRRIDEPSTGTWRGLIADRYLHSYTDFRAYLGKDTTSGLEVLASDPGDSVLTGRDVRAAWTQLQRQYPIGILDCGTQLRDDLTHAILDIADAVVVPSTTRLDGAAGAADTLNWLLAHGYPHLVHEAVVVISNVNKVKVNDAVRGLHEDFERVVRAVHYVPFDPHLSDATAIDFQRMQPPTRRAYIEAAASLVDGFASAGDREAHTPRSAPGTLR